MNNQYDERYEIRLANKSDINAIMDFIEEHWKHGHILATNRDFFEYEFLEEDGTVNFILAIDKEKGTIECVNGLLKASHDTEHLDIWGSIWKVLDGNMGMLALELIKRRVSLTGARCDLDVGDNPKTAIPVLKRLMKRYTAKMEHYYFLNQNIEYSIAKINHPVNSSFKETLGTFKHYQNVDELNKVFNYQEYQACIPYKDEWYFAHRFFNHPLYTYEVWGYEVNGKCETIFVLREQEQNGSKVLRFVDLYGKVENIKESGSFFKTILEENNYEYVDFYGDGFNNDDFLQAGFSIIEENDTNIIPNYFGPFLQENIDIWVDSALPNCYFTKADADQDRPNMI